MHALVVRVKIDATRSQEAQTMLAEPVVPMSRQRAGFTGGYWLWGLDGTHGRSIELYESEAAARAVAAGVTPPSAPVTLEGFDIFEVVATA